MRLTALLLPLIPAALLVLLPILFLATAFFGWNNIAQPLLGIFREVYFPVLPGLFFLGSFVYFKKRIIPEGKKSGPGLVDWMSLASGLLFFALFVFVYQASPNSFVYQVDSILPAAIAGLGPNLATMLLWSSFFLVLMSFLAFYWTSQRFGMDRTRLGGLMMAIIISLGIAIAIVKVPVFRTMESMFVNFRFAALRDPGNQKHETGLNYCMPPSDVSGQKLTAYAPNPPGVRDDIEIIGISNKTIEEVKGNWPLDWSIYARLTRNFSGAKDSIALFDISFLDEKGVYGGNYCGVLFDCSPIGENRLIPQVNVLANAINRAENTVISDYPMETTDESRASIVKYDQRMQVLRERSALKHVKNGRYAIPWAKMPLPPALPIARVLDGMGYANVLKDDQGYNRWVPMAIRIVNEARYMEPDYNPDMDDEFYPSIDLMVAAKYYGIDPVEDVEVDWLAGTIRLKNIPEKTYEKLNMSTFEMESHDIMAIPNNSREIVIPIDSKGLMNINFRGGRYCFKYNELLSTSRMEPEQASQYFEKKILLIAMYYATGVGTAKDTHLGPYGDMAGIEHHAYAINTILNQDFVARAPAIVNLVILLLVGIVMGLYQSRVSTLWNFLLLVFSALVIALVTFFISFDIYSYLHVFPSIIVNQLLIFTGFIGFRILTEEENVKFIRNTFSKFVSQDVVEELLANPDAISLGGSKKEVTVFFSDVRGFTTISEKLGPEELVKLLNDYLSEMTELIIDYRGTIDKYMGDAIMAFWGAPAHNDDHAYHTCVAAIANIKALMELRDKWAETNVTQLDIGIGINTGQAVVGNMGSSRRMDYTLMGDTVNLGSRLEGITKQYGVRICISEFTYERVKERVYARELDLVRVKGKLEPVRIYELMGLKNEDDLRILKKSHIGH